MIRVLVVLFLLGPGAQAAAQQAITASSPANGVTLLASPPDGNVLVVRGRDATLVVDALAPGIATRADSAIRAAARGVPRWVINTHYHADHIGANHLLAAAGATTVAHENVPALARRDTTIAELQWDLDPADPADLPATLVHDSLLIDLGGETARVRHLAHAHTGGDLIIRFDRANLLHTGDIVEFGAYPFIDWWGGGSFDGLVAAVDRILAMTDDATLVVPGHGPTLTRADVTEYRRMLETVASRVRSAIAAGESVDAIVDARPTAEWDARHGGERHGNRFVRLLHLEFTKGS